MDPCRSSPYRSIIYVGEIEGLEWRPAGLSIGTRWSRGRAVAGSLDAASETHFELGAAPCAIPADRDVNLSSLIARQIAAVTLLNVLRPRSADPRSELADAS